LNLILDLEINARVRTTLNRLCTNETVVSYSRADNTGFELLQNRLHFLPNLVRVTSACHSHLRARAYKIVEACHVRLYLLPLYLRLRLDVFRQ